MFLGSLSRALSSILIIFFILLLANSCRASPRSEITKGYIKDPVLSGTAVMAIVSLNEQKVSLFDEQGNSISSPISSGKINLETPVGIYSVLQKDKEHYSNIYDDAAMPFMQRITWSGLSLHAGQLPGYPASHGCIRLPYFFAEKIFSQTSIGMRVIVARDKIIPKPFLHTKLFQPLIQKSSRDILEFNPNSSPSPKVSFLNEQILELLPNVKKWPSRLIQQERLKKNAHNLDHKTLELERELALSKRRVEHLSKTLDEVKKKSLMVGQLIKSKSSNSIIVLNKNKEIVEKKASLDSENSRHEAELKSALELLQQASDQLNGLEDQYQEALHLAKEAKMKMLPISILVSGKTKRIYVRQGFEQIMESPISIKNSYQALGTHIYTAVGYDTAGDLAHWTSVSLKSSERTPAYIPNSYNDEHQWISDNPTGISEFEDSYGALEQIEIPAPIRERISEYVWPGSSLIVTDEEPHRETGKATDFIVLMSGEPQGGIGKRSRSISNREYYLETLLKWYDESERIKYERDHRRFEIEMLRFERKSHPSFYGSN